MIEIRRILVPTDFSPTARQAFDLGLILARGLGAEIHLLHVLVFHEDDPHNPAHHFPAPASIRRRLGELGESEMAELLGSSAGSEVEVERVQRRGFDAASAILEYAGESAADLIVIGTHGRRGLTHFLLGSIAEKVVRHAACPVLTVRGTEPPAQERAVGRLLVPVDFSEHSRSALAAAHELAGRYGAGVEVLHVVEDLSYPSYYGFGANLGQELLKRARAALDKLVTDVLGPGAEVERHIVQGRRAAPEIVRFAEQDGVDLIVISTHGHSGVVQLFYGSTVERVIQLSSVPVLTLRSIGRGSPGAGG